MLLIIGADVTGEWVVRDLEHVGEDATGPEAVLYWPVNYWPEVEVLVYFEQARAALGLASLEGTHLQ